MASLVQHLCGRASAPGRTVFASVERLEPGELLEATTTSIRRDRYWSVEIRPVLRLKSNREYAERLREVLWRVVEEYVPNAGFAITVSGGLDSTSLAACLAEVAPGVRKTSYVWTAPELPDADESRYARAVCRQLGLDAVELRADLHWPLSGGPPSGLPDEPDLGHYPEVWDATFRIVRASGLSVLFTGAGGDTLFGGSVSAYPDLFLRLRWIQLVRQFRRHLPNSSRGAAGIARTMMLGAMRRAWWGASTRSPPPWLTKSAAALAESKGSPSHLPRGLLPGRRLIVAQLAERLPLQIVTQLGRRAAQLGVVLRHPLLDHRLVEFATSLPSDQVFSAGELKFVLRNAMRGRLPEEVVSLKQKIVPLEIFQRGLRDRGKAVVAALLSNMRCADLGLIEPQRLRRSYESYVEGSGSDTRFWQALTLEAWLREYQ